MHSPSMGIMASSPATFHQFHPSGANSIVFLSAIVCSSCLSHQRRLRMCSEYSECMGIGTTETHSSNASSECSGTTDESYLRGTEKSWIGGRGLRRWGLPHPPQLPSNVVGEIKSPGHSHWMDCSVVTREAASILD